MNNVRVKVKPNFLKKKAQLSYAYLPDWENRWQFLPYYISQYYKLVKLEQFKFAVDKNIECLITKTLVNLTNFPGISKIFNHDEIYEREWE